MFSSPKTILTWSNKNSDIIALMNLMKYWGLNSFQLRILTVLIRSSLVSLICCPSIKPDIINMFFLLCIKCLSIIWNLMFFSALMQKILLFGIIFGEFSVFFLLFIVNLFLLWPQPTRLISRYLWWVTRLSKRNNRKWELKTTQFMV